ncbi:hypothetical protein R6Q57_006348 [Mikania cordata]
MRSNEHHQGFHHQKKITPNGNGGLNHHQTKKTNGIDHRDHEEEGFDKDMRNLAEMLSKLNPMAEEFVPPSLSNNNFNVGHLLPPPAAGAPLGYSPVNDFLLHTNQTPFPNITGVSARRKKSDFGHPKRRMNNRTNMAQREDVIRRTVHVSDIDQQVTEEQLAALFISCGQVYHLRLLGDYSHSTSIAFVEFVMAESAIAALNCSGAVLGSLPIRVSPSKTPVRPRAPRPPMH